MKDEWVWRNQRRGKGIAQEQRGVIILPMEF